MRALATWRNYWEVCKPKIVATMLFTVLVGMYLAAPAAVEWRILLAGTIGIGLVVAASAAINQLLDRRLDALMDRTQKRPLPAGHLTVFQVLVFSFLLGTLGLSILATWVNWLTALLTFLSMFGYSIVYTRFLKYATPQNIVIGGAAGATPPLLGWVAVTGRLEAEALLLFLIIFVWTPPHFWALALYRIEDYAKARVPMLPVTHGEDYTRLHVLLYTMLLAAVTMLPYAVGMSGLLYLLSALLLNAVFLYYAIALKLRPDRKKAMDTFSYSIVYIFLLFALLLLDAHLPILQAVLFAH